MCLSPGILRTSEHKPGWPRGSQEFPFCPEPTKAGCTMTTSPPPWAAPAPWVSPGGPITPHLLLPHLLPILDPPLRKHTLFITRHSCLL